MGFDEYTPSSRGDGTVNIPTTDIFIEITAVARTSDSEVRATALISENVSCAGRLMV